MLARDEVVVDAGGRVVRQIDLSPRGVLIDRIVTVTIR